MSNRFFRSVVAIILLHVSCQVQSSSDVLSHVSSQQHRFAEQPQIILVILIFVVTFLLLGTAGVWLWNRILLSRIQAHTQALQQEKDFTNTLLQTAPGLIVVLDRHGRIQQFNRTAEEITGYSFAEIKDRLIWDDFVLPEEIEQARAVFTSIVNDGQVADDEHYLRMRDGSRRLFAWSHAVLRDQAGQVEYVISIGADITDYRQTQTDLIAQRRLLRNVIDTANVAIFTKDRQGLYTLANRTYAHYFGLTPDEIVGQSAVDLFPPAEVARIQAVDQQVLTQGQAHISEDHLSVNGSVRIVMTAKTPLRDPQGQIIGVCGAVTDITAMKELQQEVTETAFRLQQLGDNLPGGAVFQFEYQPDDDFHFTCLSASVEAICGLDRKTIATDWRCLQPLIDQKDFPALLAAVRDSRINRSMLDQEFRLQHGKQKQWRWLHCRALPRQLANGVIRWDAVLMDITEIKVIQTALEESEARYRLLFEAADDLIFIYPLVEPQHSLPSFSEVNAITCETLGYRRDELLQMLPSDLFGTAMPMTLADRDQYLLEQGPLRFEREVQTKWNEPLVLDVHARLFELSGQLTMLAIARDITERKRSENELIQAREAAEAASRAKSAFLANMSHELRTPLNAMLGYAQILERDPNLVEQQQKSVAIIRRSGEYLLTLINDVLDLAKIEAGRFELALGRCDLPLFFANLSDLFRLRAEQKGLAFSYQGLSALPKAVVADERRLRQICMNLLGNAVKFTERGEVRLETGYRHGELMIAVVDTGVGIPLVQQQHLFRPFQQVGDGQYKQQGTGLGLSISKNLLKQMGGLIRVESQLGVGSRFTIRLPLTAIADTQPSPPTTAQAPVTGYQRLDDKTAPLKVLVVDDHIDNRAVLVQLLRPLGFEVSEVSSGAEAITIAAKWQPELILMDLVMPEIDGLTATHTIHAQPETADTVIIAVSAKAFSEDIEASQEAGCRAHLIKPVDAQQLWTVMAQCLPLKWQNQLPAETLQSHPAELIQENAVPSALLHQLEKEIIRGQADKIKAVIVSVSKEDPAIANQLLEWVENYHYEEILRFINDHLRNQAQQTA